jgi:hypothetical protein
MIFHIESYYNEIQRLNKLLESNGIKTSGGWIINSSTF